MSGEWTIFSVVLLTSTVALWGVVLFLGFLLLGALQALGRLNWRLDQLEATMPSRLVLRMTGSAIAITPSTHRKRASPSASMYCTVR